MPASPVAALICEGGAIDALSGRLTIFNALDTVFAPIFPSVLAKLWLVIVYEVGEKPDPFHERVVLKSPDGADLKSSMAEVGGNAEAILGTHTSIHDYTGAALPAQGAYSFCVYRGPTKDGPWTKITERRLKVLPRPAAQPEAAADSAANLPPAEQTQH